MIFSADMRFLRYKKSKVVTEVVWSLLIFIASQNSSDGKANGTTAKRIEESVTESG